MLGETILAPANAIVEAVQEGEHLPALIGLSAAGLVLVAGMWWTYFDRPQHHLLTSARHSFAWGYGHYFVFGAAGAVSSGIELLINVETGTIELGRAAAAAVVSVPVAVFVLFVWVFVLRPLRDPVLDAAVPTAALLVGLSCFVPGSIDGPVTAVAALVAVVAARVTIRGRGPQA